MNSHEYRVVEAGVRSMVEEAMKAFVANPTEERLAGVKKASRAWQRFNAPDHEQIAVHLFYRLTTGVWIDHLYQLSENERKALS